MHSLFYQHFQHPVFRGTVGFLSSEFRAFTTNGEKHQIITTLRRYDLDLSNPVYGYFGYRFYTTIFEEMMIKPNVLIKHEDGAPLQIDMNLSASFQNRFEIGAGYRTTSSINMLAGVYLITNFRLIYNYNIAVKDSPLGNTHGVILSYQFGKGYSNGS